jgi:membrane protein required for colicin V production
MVDFLKGAPLVDIAIVVWFFVWFVLGFMQGVIRRALGILSIVLAFMVAANLRDPVGDNLNQNWHQFSLDYNKLLAFTIFFVIGTVVSSVLIQGFYKRTDISADHPVVDDIIGGVLGLAQGLVLLLFAIVILNSSTLPPAQPGDVSQLRYVQDMIVNQSHIADALRTTIVPVVMHIMSFILPSDLVSLFP